MEQKTPRRDLDAISRFKEDLQTVLSHITIRPRRILLTTHGVEATVPMIRGVWGAALHRLDRQVYRDVFEGGANESDRTPGYILRPAPPDPDTAPAIEWISLGCGLVHDSLLIDAWKIGSQMGLGANRQPFDIRSVMALRPGNDVRSEQAPTFAWTLDSNHRQRLFLPTRRPAKVPPPRKSQTNYPKTPAHRNATQRHGN